MSKSYKLCLIKTSETIVNAGHSKLFLRVVLYHVCIILVHVSYLSVPFALNKIAVPGDYICLVYK